MSGQADTQKPPRVIKHDDVPEGMPGHLTLDRGERPKPPTKAEMQWAMLRRLETAGQPRSKVTITRNAKHEYQYTVDVSGDDAGQCADEAKRIETALAVVYPPPAPIRPEHK
jgi:hypothetical protein